jgi:anthranilate phosphoribosyltransferase
MQKQDLSKAEMVQVMDQIMTGKATDAQIGAFLAALAFKGETMEEIAGAAQVMREKATRIPVKSPNVVDTCGTGGDGSHTFNISTTAAFVAAGAGVKVAKHGNRGVSSKCGSADVLKALGVNIEIGPEKVGSCVDEVGIGFLFAPLLHGAMKHAIGPRREMGVRTVFNILGPLTNPAGAKRQVIGIFSPHLLNTIAEVLRDLKSEHVMVVHGGGLDEISPAQKTRVAELKDGTIKTYEIDPEKYSISKADPKALAGGDPAANAEILKAVLKGEKGARRDAVLLNAGAAVHVSGRAKSLDEGVKLAAQSIDSGAALKVLEKLVAFSNS